jgi:nicotinamide-nucleotide amidase
MNELLVNKAYAFGKRLQSAGWKVSSAESCTGGLIAAALTEKSGSSAWFDRSVVTYSNEAKQQLLNVSVQTLSNDGAVSELCAREMAAGLLLLMSGKSAELLGIPAVAISVTGIAGPTGAVPGKPVGTVCFGCATRDIKGVIRLEAQTRYFSGDRAAIRQQASLHALTYAEMLFLSAISSGLNLDSIA